MIRHHDLFLAVYGKLHTNRGATTPGVNPEDTVDGMSLARIDRIIGQLEAGTYQWTPVKRVYIGKKRGGKRPLGLPGWNDKLVVEDELIPQYSRGKRRRRNPEYRRLSRQMSKAQRTGNLSEYRRLQQQRRTTPSKDPTDDTYRRLKYCRYCDDFILGFIGPKSEAEKIKAKISAFLRNLMLRYNKREAAVWLTLVPNCCCGDGRQPVKVYRGHSSSLASPILTVST